MKNIGQIKQLQGTKGGHVHCFPDFVLFVVVVFALVVMSIEESSNTNIVSLSIVVNNN